MLSTGYTKAERVLVTGGSGLLGSALVARLQDLREDWEILAPGREVLDLASASAVEAYFGRTKPDTVVHLAAFVRGLGGNMAAGHSAFTANADINHQVLSACLRHKVERVFVAGTVAMYPHPYPHLPLIEEDVLEAVPHEGELHYALAKRAMVPYLQAMEHAHGTHTSVGLYTNLFGPRDRFNDDSGHVIPSLISRFVTAHRAGAHEVAVWGRATTTRDFLYVDDAVEATLALTFDVQGMYNVATGVESTMQQLVDATVLATGYEGRVVWDAAMPIGIPRRAVSAHRLEAALASWEPRNLDIGIKSTVDWYTSNY